MYVFCVCMSVRTYPLTVPPAIPHFKEVIVMALTCDTCGYRSNEIKSGSGVSEKGTRITLHLTDPSDLSRDILRVGVCRCVGAFAYVQCVGWFEPNNLYTIIYSSNYLSFFPPSLSLWSLPHTTSSFHDFCSSSLFISICAGVWVCLCRCTGVFAYVQCVGSFEPNMSLYIALTIVYSPFYSPSIPHTTSSFHVYCSSSLLIHLHLVIVHRTTQRCSMLPIASSKY